VLLCSAELTHVGFVSVLARNSSVSADGAYYNSILQKVLKTYAIDDDNVVGFMRDAAAVGGSAVSMLRSSLQLSDAVPDITCLAHNINLILREKIAPFETPLAFLKSMNRIATGSRARTALLDDIVGKGAHNHITSAGTRWTSRLDAFNYIISKFGQIRVFCEKVILLKVKIETDDEDDFKAKLRKSSEYVAAMSEHDWQVLYLDLLVVREWCASAARCIVEVQCDGVPSSSLIDAVAALGESDMVDADAVLSRVGKQFADMFNLDYSYSGAGGGEEDDDDYFGHCTMFEEAATRINQGNQKANLKFAKHIQYVWGSIAGAGALTAHLLSQGRQARAVS